MDVGVDPGLAEQGEDGIGLEPGDVEQAAQHVDELAPAIAAGARMGPGGALGTEHLLLGTLQLAARDEVLDRRRHLRRQMADAADAARRDQLVRLLEIWLEAPAIGHEDLAACLVRGRDQPAGIGRIGRHRLLDHDMAALGQRRHRLLGMEMMRRRDDDAVHLDIVEQFLIGLVGVREAKGFLDLRELRRAGPRDADQLDIRVALQDRQMVGDGPGAGADDADARLAPGLGCLSHACSSRRDQRRLAPGTKGSRSSHLRYMSGTAHSGSLK